jgi:hypothetical protein
LFSSSAQNKFNPFINNKTKVNIYQTESGQFNNASLYTKTPVHFAKYFMDTTEECDINLINGSLLKEVRIVDSNDSSFTVLKSDINKVFPIQQLHKITFIRHGFWKGCGYGMLGSVAFWSIFGLLSTNGEWRLDFGTGFIVGIVLGIPTALISGMITEFATNDDVYNFGTINPSAKSKWLQKIVSEHEK